MSASGRLTRKRKGPVTSVATHVLDVAFTVRRFDAPDELAATRHCTVPAPQMSALGCMQSCSPSAPAVRLALKVVTRRRGHSRWRSFVLLKRVQGARPVTSRPASRAGGDFVQDRLPDVGAVLLQKDDVVVLPAEPPAEPRRQLEPARAAAHDDDLSLLPGRRRRPRRARALGRAHNGRLFDGSHGGGRPGCGGPCIIPSISMRFDRRNLRAAQTRDAAV